MQYTLPVTDPTITTTGTLTDFNAAVGQSSAEQSYTVAGTNLTEAITVTAPSDFQVSLSSGTGWATSVSTAVPSTGTVLDTTIYVRLNPTSATTYTSLDITNASTGATTQNVVVSGSSVPTITTTGTLNAFSSEPGTPSVEQSYDVSGINLTEGIAILAPTDFEISTTSGGVFGSSLTLPQTGGLIASTPIYVRFNRSTVGTSSGDITHTSAGATTQNVAVSGDAAYVIILQDGLDGYSGTRDTYI